jgi:Uma2 family endonuclease
MKTLLKIGPRDHGRRITDGELRHADFVSGYKYELIDGRLYVTYEPDPPEDYLEKWLLFKVETYSRLHPEVLNYVTNKARIFLPGKHRRTIPEPDLAAYLDFPLHLPLRKIKWHMTSPLLVGEVLSPHDGHKDLIRNVELYLRVPSIMEYWILDGREDPDRPTMLVYRRRGTDWQDVMELDYRAVYRTKLLRDFALMIRPRS